MSKPPMPEYLLPMAEAAAARHKKRRFIPEVTQTDKGWGCPYSEEYEHRWFSLLYDVFGTRHTATVEMFFNQLSSLLKCKWNASLEQWLVDGESMVALLTMVQAMKPQDEAQAGLAAQLVALHLCSMRLAKGALSYGAGDARSVAVLAKATHAYGDGLATMRRLQGKGGSSRQSIKVEKRVYYQQANIRGGDGHNGGQVHGKPSTDVVETSATVPCAEPSGQVVRLPCRQREERLQDARGRSR